MYEHISYCGAGKFVSRGEWIHPDRIITSYELIFVLSGSVYITENGRQYQLNENDMLLLEPEQRHFGYKKSSNTSFFWLHTTGAPEHFPKFKYQAMKNSHTLSLLFKQLLHHRAENRSPESLDYLARLILMECFSSKENAASNRLVSEVAAWIAANRSCPVKAEEISAHFGYNTDYLSRLFKANYAKSLKEYISDIRINYIKQLLLTKDLPLNEIASMAGFDDYKLFLKFFKYHEGLTPTQFLKTYPQTYINTN